MSSNSSIEPSAVVVVEPERMNLLGLMLKSLLERRMNHSAARRHARALRGKVLIEASGMRVLLRFTQTSIEISREFTGRADAEIRGTLTALLRAALGRQRARSLITGQLRARGAPLMLLRILSLLRT